MEYVGFSFAYSSFRCLDAHSRCKEKASLVSTKCPVVSEEAPNRNCRQRSSIVSRKPPTVSNEVASRQSAPRAGAENETGRNLQFRGAVSTGSLDFAPMIFFSFLLVSCVV